MRVLMISKACVTATYRTKLVSLNRLQPDVTVGLVVPPQWGTLPFEPMPEDATYPLYIVPALLNGHHHFHRYRGLSKIVAQFRPDFIHIDEEHYSWVTDQAVQIAKRLKIPTVFFTWQNLFKAYPWPFSAIEKRVFGYVSGAIAGNHEALEVLRRKGFQKPVAVIPQFGVDPRFSPEVLPSLPLPAGWERNFVIGYVGRLIAEKGLDDLLAAVARVMAKRDDVRLVLVGTGPWQSVGQAQAVLRGIDARVQWVPWVRSDEMPGTMVRFKTLVLPSRTGTRWKEQFGRVLTEAMASGVPVVGSNSGEIPEVIGEAGRVFPEGDDEALAEALLELHDDSDLWHRLRSKGIERVRAHFTQEVIAHKTLAVYASLLSPRARPGVS